MINFNGKIVQSKQALFGPDNRAFKYGDALFETVKVKNSKISFLEDHYFRLMASMRMLRMKISMDFTLEAFESEILKLVKALQLSDVRVRFSVFRKEGGLYLPTNQEIDFLIEASPFESKPAKQYEVDLFKDYYTYSGVLSTLKTNNKILNVLASIFADENGLDNCIIMNEHKHIVEAMNANIFIVKGTEVLTPALSEGCLKGIMRKNIISILEQDTTYSLKETSISPFELQKADEAFISNSIIGIQEITKYRKREFTNTTSVYLRKRLAEIEA